MPRTIVIILTIFALFVHSPVYAQSSEVLNWEEVVEHTLQEEKEGEELWRQLQDETQACTDLNDESFAVLGEYFMGQMMGNSHAAMNAMMIQAHGEDGEEQIHIVMGKRLSGCDASATFIDSVGGWMPMMQMMLGGWSGSNGFGSGSMMNIGRLAGFGWLFLIILWALVIIGIIAIAKWFLEQFSSHNRQEESALKILKIRYAKGEIDKQEFEQRKKDV